MNDRIVAVVLNWNKAADTAECVDSLMRSDGVQLEVLLVDNGSTDDSALQLRQQFPTIVFLQTGANLGYTGGNNRGIERALAGGADWILVINNDTVASPDCVQRLLAGIVSDNQLAAVAPLIVRHDNPRVSWFAGGHLSMMRALGMHHQMEVHPPGDPEASEAVQSCTYLCGCCILFRAQALREVGSFREDFFAYIEDVELSYRLSRAGWTMGWVKQARLSHKVPAAGTPDSAWQIRLRDRNRRRLVRSLFPVWWRLGFAFWFWPTRLIHLARFVAGGDRARAQAVIAGMVEG